MEPPIRAITVDAGGTLLFPWPSVGQIYARVVAQAGFAAPPAEDIDRNFAQAWKLQPDFTHTKPEWRAVVQSSLGSAFLLTDAMFETIYEEFNSPECWRIAPGAKKVLEWARSQGIKLAVVSNWDERLRPLLRRLEMADWFDHVVVSSEMGFTKPDSRIFSHACSLLEVAPEEAIHVGDSLREDVDGALGAGLKAWHLRTKPSDAVLGGGWEAFGERLRTWTAAD